jgi:hypothetical protein
MKVNGYELSSSDVDSAIRFMKNSVSFYWHDIEAVLEGKGVPRVMKNGYYSGYRVSMRAADRIIQQQRKQGNIEYDRKDSKWKWVGSKA